jgi:hypothetical protein
MYFYSDDNVIAISLFTPLVSWLTFRDILSALSPPFVSFFSVIEIFFCSVFIRYTSSSFSYPYPTKRGDKDSAIVFTTGRLPDVNPPWNWSGYKRQNVGANAAGTNGLTWLPKHGVRDNKFWSPIRWLAFGNVA